MINIYRSKIYNSTWYNYYFNDGVNYLKIIFGGNGDLYFGTRFEKNKEFEFLITKENFYIYNLFDELFINLKEAKVYEVYESKFYNTPKEEYIKINEWNQKIKNSYMYQKLFHSEDVLTWISDDSVSFNIENADTLRIIKENDRYKLKFTYYENEFPHVRTIRIRNSGSRYSPFNIIMMKFFNKLQEYDPNYHQIHIEEYLYNRNVKKLKKTSNSFTKK